MGSERGKEGKGGRNRWWEGGLKGERKGGEKGKRGKEMCHYVPTTTNCVVLHNCSNNYMYITVHAACLSQ